MFVYLYRKFGFKNLLLSGLSLLVAICLIVSKAYSYYVLKNHIIESQDLFSKNVVSRYSEGLELWFSNKFKAIDILEKHYSTEAGNAQNVALVRYIADAAGFGAVLISVDDGTTFGSVYGDAWEDGLAKIDMYDARTRPWYKLGAQSPGSVQITDVYEDNFTKNKLISVVKGFNGGVLLGDIELSILKETVERIDYPHAKVTIVDHKGNVLVSNSELFVNHSSISSSLLSGSQESILSPGDNELSLKTANIDKLIFKSDFSMAGDKKWHFMIDVDRDLVYEPIYESFISSVTSTLTMLSIFLLVSFVFLNYLYKPIIQLNNVIYDLNSGSADLTKSVPVNSNDHLGKISSNINNFMSRLRLMMLKIYDATENIEHSATKIANMTEDNLKSIVDHSSQTHQVAAAITEMSITSNEIASNTAAAAKFTKETSDKAEKSMESIRVVTSSMNVLASNMEATVGQTSSLGNDASKITSVLKVIGEIASQTNLLALNAAIEAARAGEQGRGFAVVADEVRALAGRTHESTIEIETTLEKLRDGVNNTISSMSETKEACLKASQYVESVATDIEDINMSVKQINEYNTQIAQATVQQSQVSDSLTVNMESLNEMAKMMAKHSDYTSQQTTELMISKDQLRDVVKQFKL